MRQKMTGVVDVLAALLAVGCVAAICCWVAVGTGWNPLKWELSFADLPAHAPTKQTFGVTSAKGLDAFTEGCILIERYRPMDDSANGMPEEVRGDMYPFTAWALRLTHASKQYGFSDTTMPVFDPKHRHLLGSYQEWGIPYWFVVLATGLLPAVRAARNFARRDSIDLRTDA